MTTHSLQQPAGVGVVAATDERYCLECGYNLRGLVAERCPECGRTVDEREHGGLHAPWVYRARVGRFTAYWQTVALVTFRPGDFATGFDWPRVRFHGSETFRLWTIAWAAAAIVLGALAVAWRFGVGATGLLVLGGALAPSALLFAYGATDLAGFFTGPRLPSDTSEEVFRARLINDYASAALAWTPLPAIVLCAGVWAGKIAAGPAEALLFMLAAVLAAWVSILWIGGTLVLFGTTLSLRPGILVLAAVFFPMRFAGMALLTTMFVFAPLACAVGGLISLAPR